jgi:hypothetical protein
MANAGQKIGSQNVALGDRQAADRDQQPRRRQICHSNQASDAGSSWPEGGATGPVAAWRRSDRSGPAPTLLPGISVALPEPARNTGGSPT